MSRRKGVENAVQCVPEDTSGLLEPFKSHRWGWKAGDDIDVCLLATAGGDIGEESSCPSIYLSIHQVN